MTEQLTDEEITALLRHANEELVNSLPLDLDAGLQQVMEAKIDVVYGDVHRYWSTHCRHGRHEDCNATELAPGIPRRPAQCKTCAAPCLCNCHQESER